MINDYVLDLNQFKIIRTLGSGGCGEVFLVKNKDGKQFAVKIIKNDQDKQDMQIEFYREIESFAKTKYPAILSFIGHNIYGFKDKHFQQL